MVQLGGGRSGNAVERSQRRRDVEVRPLAGRGLVHRVVRQLDQGIGQAPLPAALVLFAGLPGQRLQGGLDSRSAERVEDAAHGHRTVLLLVQAKRPLLHSLRLLAGHALRVCGVAGLPADVPEATDADLFGLRQQVLLVDWAFAHGALRACHENQVLKADLRIFNGCHRGAERIHLLPDTDQVGGCLETHLALVTNPVQRGDGAHRLAVLDTGKVGSDTRGT